MKILYVITKSNWGGAQKYVYDLATESTKRGNTVAVAFGGEGALKEKLDAAGIKTFSIPTLMRDVGIIREIKSLLYLHDLVKKYQPDILHLNSSKAGGLGGFIARVLPKEHRPRKTVFTAHGWAFTEKRSALSKFVILWTHWLTVLLNDTTIAVSAATKKEIAHLPFMKKKVVVIPNGIEQFPLMEPRVAKKELLTRTNMKDAINLWKNTTLWIGSIGELHTNKGFDVAIRALSGLKDTFHEQKASFIYLIIGGGERREELEELIRKHRLETNVFLLGNIPDAKTYLRAFDIFLFPSRKEGLPYTILEAGFAHRGVIASEVGGISEVITSDATGILVPPEDPGEIRQAIVDLARDPQKRKRYGEALFNHTSLHYTLNHMTEKTLALYRTL